MLSPSPDELIVEFLRLVVRADRDASAPDRHYAVTEDVSAVAAKSQRRAFFSQVTNSPGTGSLNAVVGFLVRFVDSTTYSFTDEKRPACCCAA